MSYDSPSFQTRSGRELWSLAWAVKEAESRWIAALHWGDCVLFAGPRERASRNPQRAESVQFTVWVVGWISGDISRHSPPACPFRCSHASSPSPNEVVLTSRNITDPRALALVLEQAEAKLAKEIHPDPYRRVSFNLSLDEVSAVQDARRAVRRPEKLTHLQPLCSLADPSGAF